MGGSPKAPPPPPDPRIAEEESRREGIKIGQLEQQRRSRAGGTSTILGGSPTGTTALTRPTEEIQTIDPSSTSAAQKQVQIDKMASEIALMPDTIKGGRSGGEDPESQTRENTVKTQRQKELETLRKGVSPAELQVLQDAKKQQNIAQYIGRTRSRLGVAGTKGA